ncbi:MAG TPA: ribonuclease P protein subunit [Geobacterales bacterium]|nr:ribonuclease P protein subunit [Geobacterales bacterium]
MRLKKENLIAHELMGLEVIVMNKEGIELQHGIVYNETKETLSIKSDKIRTYLKRSNDFIFMIDDEKIKINGEYLVARPEERVKKI